MIFGLTGTENVTTAELGSIGGWMIRWKEICFAGYDAAGDAMYEVVFEFFENRYKYLEKEKSLKVIAENKRVVITVPYGTELTDTIIHQSMKTPLAGVYTLADENT